MVDAILNKVLDLLIAIFPLNWVSVNFELSLKHVGSQARVGVLYSERSDYNLVERH